MIIRYFHFHILTLAERGTDPFTKVKRSFTVGNQRDRS
jgi:hypothetical protein